MVDEEREAILEELACTLQIALRNLAYAELPSDKRTWSNDELDDYYAAMASVELAQDAIREFHDGQR